MNVKVNLTESEVLQAVRDYVARRMGPGWQGTGRAVLHVDRETSEVTASCDSYQLTSED